MLDSDRTLELARPAGGALKHSFLRNMRSDQRLLTARAEFIQITPDAEHNVFRIKYLAGVRSRAVLTATAAFHSTVRLQRNQLGQILAGIEPEIFVSY